VTNKPGAERPRNNHMEYRMTPQTLIDLEEQLELESNKQAAAILDVDYRRYWEWKREQRPVPRYIVAHIRTILIFNKIAPGSAHTFLVEDHLRE